MQVMFCLGLQIHGLTGVSLEEMSLPLLLPSSRRGAIAISRPGGGHPRAMAPAPSLFSPLLAPALGLPDVLLAGCSVAPSQAVPDATAESDAELDAEAGEERAYVGALDRMSRGPNVMDEQASVMP